MPYVVDEFTGRNFGKYEVLCRLAVGGMAEIFLAFTKVGANAGRPVVLKRILTEHREDDHSLQMLIDEAKITATLNHANVARVLDLEVAGDEVLLVIEFIDGATVEELVTAVLSQKEVVPLGFVLATIRDCAQGLQHAHQHKDTAGKPLPIIHRDVTPKNLMVDFNGVGKVLDFGIARAMGSSRRTVAGMVRGTSAYMSPEQAVDAKMDIRTDLFSLGVIFHELLTGQRLFYRGNPGKEMAAVYEAEVPAPSTVNRRVPKALDAVVLKALERPLARRYQTALELVRDLQLAAGSTLWAPERCAELVRTRFSRRRDEIAALVKRIPLDEEVSVSFTKPGRPAFDEASATTLPLPLAPRIPPVPAKPEANTDEQALQEAGDDAIPTKFFTPSFNSLPRVKSVPPAAPPAPANPRPSPGPIPDLSSLYDEQIKTQLVLPGEPGTSPASSPTHPQVVRRTSTGSGRKTLVGGTSRLGLALAALGALSIGAVGGIILHKSMTTGPAPAGQGAGLGRLTLDTDRPGEVQLRDGLVARLPLVDQYIEAGRHQFKIREPNGPWLALDVDVKPDQVTKLSVKLDTLQPVP